MKKVYVVWMAALLAVGAVRAQDEKPGVEFRFRTDQAVTEQADDLPEEWNDVPAQGRLFGYMLDGKPVSRIEADNSLTLWNVSSVRSHRCRRRLRHAPHGKRIETTLLRFRTRSRTRPHLKGNIAGYRWDYGEKGPAGRGPVRITHYVLYSDYDSIRRIHGGKYTAIPPAEWRSLPARTIYVLDGKVVRSDVMMFIEGLILQSLELKTDDTALRYGGRRGDPVVMGRIYPDRRPLVLLDGDPLPLEKWLEMCRGDVITMESGINYFYMLPLEAVERYGKKGKYGVIYVRSPID